MSQCHNVTYIKMLSTRLEVNVIIDYMYLSDIMTYMTLVFYRRIDKNISYGLFL